MGSTSGFTKLANINKIVGYGAEKAAQRITLAAIIGGTISKATGGKFANGAATAAVAQIVNGETDKRNQELSYEATIKRIAQAYRDSGLDFTREDALVSLKSAMSSDRMAIALINRAGNLNEAQMQLALETAVVMSYSGEDIELIGETRLIQLKGAPGVVRNTAGNDFDLMDIRENLNDGFTIFGFSPAARRAGIFYIARPLGMGRFHKLFDPNVRGL